MVSLVVKTWQSVAQQQTPQFVDKGVHVHCAETTIALSEDVQLSCSHMTGRHWCKNGMGKVKGTSRNINHM